VIELKVNGQSHKVSADPDTPLLYVLRDDLQLNAAKFGCGLGQCGSCTVLVDGTPTLSCVTPIMLLGGRQITTVEGLGTPEDPGPMQRAFIEEQSAQCGYCIPGMMMRAQALLLRNPRASDTEIRAYLEPNLCRCGTHMRILRAVKRAASLMGGSPTTQTPSAAGTQIDAPDADSESQSDRRRPIHSEKRERPER
jgi:nicotinate dehydrogenase subunit A